MLFWWPHRRIEHLFMGEYKPKIKFAFLSRDRNDTLTECGKSLKKKYKTHRHNTSLAINFTQLFIEIYVFERRDNGSAF